MKNNIEYVKYELSKKDFILLSKKYINGRIKLIIKDKHGYLYYSTFENIQADKYPYKFSSHNIFSIRNIRNYIKINNLSCELISENFNSVKENLLFKCVCGNEFSCSFDKVIQRKKDRCNVCSKKISAYNTRKNLNDVKTCFVENNYKPIFKNYINAITPLLCKNKDGYIGELTYQNLMNGDTFAPFSLNNKYLVNNIKHYIEINKIQSELITTNFSKFSFLSSNAILFKCKCGIIYETTWRSFTYQKVFRCPICSKKKSQYAYLTENFLDEINVKFIPEYKFKDCKDKAVLAFDYFIKLNEKVLLIEVDGQFHYNAVYNEKSFESQIYRDNIKNEYCKQNNLNLLRIPYWEYSDNCYKNKI